MPKIKKLLLIAFCSLSLLLAPLAPVQADECEGGYVNCSYVGKNFKWNRPGDMINYNLSGVSGLDLSYSNFSYSNFSKANFRLYCQDDYYAWGQYTCRSWASVRSHFIDANLKFANLSGAMFSDAGYGFFDSDLSFSNLSQAFLGDSSLFRVNLTGANISGMYLNSSTKFGNLKACNLGGTPNGTLPEGWRLEKGCLIGPSADVSDSDLSGSNFTGMDFTNSKFINTKLANSNFSGAKLISVDLTNADLSFADFKGVFLRSVKSGGIAGTPSNLSKDWKIVKGYLLGPTAVLNGAQLSDLSLTNLNLDFADLTGANLSWSNLSSTSLNGAKLAGANLTGATGLNIMGTPASLPTGWSINSAGNLQGPSTTGEETIVNLSEVTITGEPKIGSLLDASVEVTPSSSGLSYQWLRNGELIAGATQSRYVVTNNDFGKAILARVTAENPGYLSASLSSNSIEINELASFAPFRDLVISGASTLGDSLRVSFSNPVDGASIKTEITHDGLTWSDVSAGYTPEISDLGLALTVRLTKLAPGYHPLSVTKQMPNIVSIIPNSPCAPATVSDAGYITEPAISGAPRYLNRLIGHIGSWPKGVKFCTFWLKDDKVQVSKTTSHYLLASTDIGSKIQFGVVATSPTLGAKLVFSQPVFVDKQVFTRASTPTISGQSKVGSALRPRLGANWAAGASYTYQWFKLDDGSAPISEDPNYLVSAQDLGSKIILRVCASKEFYETLCLDSQSIGPIALGTFDPPPSIKLSGTPARPGTVLQVNMGSWPSGTQLEYAWFRNGVPLEASGRTYLISSSDIGASISVTVTARKAGYQSLAVSSLGRLITR